ncbi:alpha/beta hydrolase [Micromonospora sp. DT201]|uniref:alpha/beta hydrolase n=1 Tax=Micromonospora sp. DT201 TaxID=3393442 RepID=UPI003CEEBB37
MNAVADAELTMFIETLRDNPPPPAHLIGADALRTGQRQRVAAQPRGPELADVCDERIGDVAVRIYRPQAASQGTVVYVHGGMWVIGDLESHDRVCRRLAKATGATVIAVDYRRAPENPWPAAVQDVLTVLRPVTASDGPVLVMGDSSGGNLAALACLRLRDDDSRLPDAQVLAYPNTDLTLGRPSTCTKATGWGLSTEDVAWGVELWVPDPQLRADPHVSPLFADVKGLPRAVVVTAEHDPLRDEGDAYADRLRQVGVPTEHRCEAGLVHGFLTMDVVSPACAAAGDRIFADIAALLEES